MKDAEDKSEKTEGKIKLKVVEALQEDAYKGIARIDKNTMNFLGIKSGDVILIKGERETVAIADKAYPSDSGEQIIRIDGIIRKNAKTGVGESVSVSKANLKEAKKITIAPAQAGIMVKGDPEGLKQNLLGRTFVKGDLLVMSARGQGGRRSQTPSDFDDFFGGDFSEMLSGMLGGGMAGINNPISQLRFAVVNLDPKQPCIVTENTELILNSKAVEISEDKIGIPEVTYEDIGGLDEEIKKLREMVELPLKHPEIFSKLGIEPPKGVLLYGPPGTGKTLLAKAVASESEAHFILLNGPEIMSKFYGESEKKIREIFDSAEKNAPSIIFIDEIDAIAPKREDSVGEVERRVVSQLLTMMDGLKSRGKVVVIGATNLPNSIDPALRRPGRFDREISFTVPDKKGRLNILKIHTRNMPLTKDVNLDEISSVTHGFVGADLSALCKEAAMSVLRKVLPDLKLNKDEEELSSEVLDKLKITQKDFKEGLKSVQPSAMREVLVESPNVKWNEVGGLESAKQELKEAIEWPIKNPDAFARLGIRPPRGILLYGPPGTGKTLLAKAVATESEANFIQVKGPSLLSMWVGKSEEGIRKVFERAKQVAPCIIFFDELDALAGRRGMEMGHNVTERVLNQLLAEMDGIESLEDVVIIGATNRPDMLDAALLRPGRFDRLVFVGSPNREEREAIFKVHTKNMPLAKDVSIAMFAEKAEGYSGADIEGVCREAAMLALREDINTKSVKKKDFDNALKKIGGSISPDDLKRYKEIESKYLRSARAALNKQSYTG
ncbi:CDC48 family AAA ATPase [Candidatus Pacearchaeota archaeon]|nr:CDC48 family AAA ATPase [Candidatus Pacearchaeota archaeon]